VRTLLGRRLHGQERKIAEIDFLIDAERVAHLYLTVLDD
jgi:hypothetical protein